jgi:hypothetical protein
VRAALDALCKFQVPSYRHAVFGHVAQGITCQGQRIWQHESDMWESLFARTMRTAALAAVCVLLAVLGHVLSSPTLLPQWSAAQAWCAVFAAGYLFTGCERTLPAITGFVLAAQVLLHAWFATTQVPASSTRCVAVADLPPGLTVPGVCGSAVPSWAVSSLMLTAYLVCALVCAWWLRRGEKAYFAVGRIVHVLRTCGRALLRTALVLLRRFVPFRSPQPPKPIDRGTPTQKLIGARLPVVRRGPPAHSRHTFA